MHNVRYSVRSLLQAPGFSLIVIAVLGLGITYFREDQAFK